MKKIIKKILTPIIKEIMSDTINEVKELKSTQKTLKDTLIQLRVSEIK